MSAGAVQVAPRLCSHPGCCLPAQARSRCSKHWKQWARKNPETRIYNLVLDTVLDCLPGHHAQIIKDSGMCGMTVRRALLKLKETDRAHIGDHKPPTRPGTRWKAVWVAGAGCDAKLTAKMKAQHRQRLNRESYARRNTSIAGWAAPLGLRMSGIAA